MSYPDIGNFYGHSIFVSAQQFLDTNTFNSVNFSVGIYKYENQTLHQSLISNLLCPSDPSVLDITTYQTGYQNIPEGKFLIAYSSYAGCSGTWYHASLDLPQITALTSQDNGIFYSNSSTHIAEITDGTSSTLMLGERVHAPFGQKFINCDWWFDGYFGDTLFWSIYKINSYKTVSPDIKNPYEDSPFVTAPSSFHSGGANFAFCDGSVKFIKDSISTWDSSFLDGFPNGLTGSFHSRYTLSHGTNLGVFQVISTRNGQDFIANDL